jgi:cob(I)alamin adenosyltransferase
MNQNRKIQGRIQVYTGNGKGKTTAALGLALRAAGRGRRTFFGQFLKGQEYGELEAAKRLSPEIKIRQFGRDTFIHVKDQADEEDIRQAREGLQACREAMLSGDYHIVVLDEINVAIYFKLISEQEIHAFLDLRPPAVEVVCTGRYAPDSLIERADLVTEMQEVKHYYAQGVRARDGIEK